MNRRLRMGLLALLPALGPLLVGTAYATDPPAAGGGVEVIVAIDTSGSVRPAIEVAKAVAHQFVAAMPASMRIGIETFSNTVTVLTRPTTDRALLDAQIDPITTGGSTKLYDVVVAASADFTVAATRKVLVVLSDGRDDGSRATLEQAVAAVKGVSVESISLTTGAIDLASLDALGTVTSADDRAGVSAAFARIAGLVDNGTTTTRPVATTPPPTAAPVTTTVPAVVPTATTPATTVAPATTTSAPATTIAPVTGPAVVGGGAAAPPSSSSGPSGPADRQLWLGAGVLFVGLFALVLLLFPRQRVSKARLGIDHPRNVSEIGKRTVSAVDEALERHGKRTDLATALTVADIAMPPAEFATTVAIIAVIAGFVGLLIGGLLVAITFIAVVGLAAWLYVSRAKAKRQNAFADQLPEVLQLITTALRSGFGIAQAIESVAEEADDPARSEFARVLVETRFGRELSDAMGSLAQRMECKDLEWVVGAIEINRQAGGNLSEILNTVSGTIRERRRIARQVRTLTAEGRMSARILTALPVAMTLWQWRVNPDHFDLLLHGAGLIAFIAAGVLMILGSLWVRHVVREVVL